jgi:hypothetical protein
MEVGLVIRFDGEYFVLNKNNWKNVFAKNLSIAIFSKKMNR